MVVSPEEQAVLHERIAELLPHHMQDADMIAQVHAALLDPTSLIHLVVGASLTVGMDAGYQRGLIDLRNIADTMIIEPEA